MGIGEGGGGNLKGFQRVELIEIPFWGISGCRPNLLFINLLNCYLWNMNDIFIGNFH